MDAVKIIEEINTQRDRNLHAKLDELKYEILEKVDVSINKRMQHLNSSPETVSKFNKVDVLCAQRGEQIISMKDDIRNVRVSLVETNKKLDEIIEKLDRKYAAKWTEKVMIWGGAIVGTAILGALLSLIIKQAH